MSAYSSPSHPTIPNIPIASASWEDMSSTTSSDCEKNSDDSSISAVEMNGIPTVFRTPNKRSRSHSDACYIPQIPSARLLSASGFSPTDAINSPRSRSSRFRSWTADGISSQAAPVPFLTVRSPIDDEVEELSRPRSSWCVRFVIRLSLVGIIYIGCIHGTTTSVRRHPTYHTAFSNLHGREVPLETIRLEAIEATIETKLVHDDRKFIPPAANSLIGTEPPQVVVIDDKPKLRAKRRPQLYMAKSNRNAPLFVPNKDSSLLLSSQTRYSPSRESDSYYHFRNDDDDRHWYQFLGWCMLGWCILEMIYLECTRRSRRANLLYSGTRRVLYQR